VRPDYYQALGLDIIMSDGGQGNKKKRKSRPGKRDREAMKKLKEEGGAEVGVNTSAPAPTGEHSPIATVQDIQWNFEVDYNDHFETPLRAYEDLLVWMKEEAKVSRKSIEDCVVYDPYYCAGGMVPMLKGKLGFKKVINENVCFYETIENGRIPAHDFLVTNPPYSGDHKTKLLDYLSSTARSATALKRPFALLLPAYTATKSYWRDFTAKHASSCLYLMPKDRYEYVHPEGTGKEIPPFYSCWFLGNCAVSLQTLKEAYSSSSSSSSRNVIALDSVEEMARRNYVTLERRPSSKRRKKLMKGKAGYGGKVA
jgi:hypothetical protein